MNGKAARAYSDEQIRQWWASIDKAASEAPTVTPTETNENSPEPSKVASRTSAAKNNVPQRKSE